MQNTTTQVDFFEKKIAELKAERKRYAADLGHSPRRDRTIYLYLDAFDRDLRLARRSLASLREQNVAAGN